MLISGIDFAPTRTVLSHDSELHSLCSLLQRSSEPALYPMTNKIFADLEQVRQELDEAEPGKHTGTHHEVTAL